MSSAHHPTPPPSSLWPTVTCCGPLWPTIILASFWWLFLPPTSAPHLSMPLLSSIEDSLSLPWGAPMPTMSLRPSLSLMLMMLAALRCDSISGFAPTPPPLFRASHPPQSHCHCNLSTACADTEVSANFLMHLSLCMFSC